MSAYDKYFVQRGAANHLKFRRLSVPERSAFFLGVLSIAAGAEPRGRLLVGPHEATAEDVAHEASVPVPAARSALRKLEDVGMLIRDDEPGLLVHDWEDYQPAPKRKKPSDSAEARRERKQKSRAGHANGHARDMSVTSHGHAPEVEVEVEVEEKFPPSPPEGGRRRDMERWEDTATAYLSTVLPDVPTTTSLKALKQGLKWDHVDNTVSFLAFVDEYWPELRKAA